MRHLSAANDEAAGCRFYNVGWPQSAIALFTCARGGSMLVLMEPSGFSTLSGSTAVLKAKFSAVCLLVLCPCLSLCLSLCGCTESTEKSKTERTGAVGVTSQDIDDLAKPAAPAKNPN